MTAPEAPLPIDPAPEYHKAEARFQQVAWAAMLALTGAALLGLFGGGPLSQGRAQSVDGILRIEYPRFGRGSTAADLVVFVSGEASVNGRWVVSMPTRYLDYFDLESTLPQPAFSRANEDATVWEFDGADRGSGVIRFSLRVKGESFGVLQGAVEASGRRVEFKQYIWP